MVNAAFTFKSPGVYLSEGTWGVIPTSLAAHKSVYVLGYSPLASAPKNIPTYVTSKDDFINVFGTNTASANSIELFFTQRTGSGLYFINVPVNPAKTLTIPTATAGTVYSLTIDGFTYAYTASATDTPASILSALATLVNTGSLTVYLSGNVLKHPTATVVTATANITLATQAAPTVPDIRDVLGSLKQAFDADMEQGFVMAPEFYQRFTATSDLDLLTDGLESLAADASYYWVALIDCSASASTGDVLNKLKTERAMYESPKGHSWYYAPYLMVGSVAVPPSTAIAGIALRAMQQDGFAQPAAGKRYPLRGVTGTSAVINRAMQDVLNPLGINAIRSFPNEGVIVYGARTLSTSTFYKFCLTRVILNILSGTLEASYQTMVLNSVDGLGVTFANIKGTAVTVCERLRTAGALYGATADVAYRVVCDETNNPSVDLEAGKVAVDVIVVPSPTLEVMHVRLMRAAIGSPLTEAVQGTVNTTQVATTSQQVSPPGTPNSLSVR